MALRHMKKCFHKKESNKKKFSLSFDSIFCKKAFLADWTQETFPDILQYHQLNIILNFHIKLYKIFTNLKLEMSFDRFPQ